MLKDLKMATAKPPRHAPRRITVIQNTRDLRSFLIETMVGVVNETLTPGQAAAVCNVAQQIYNTLNVELRAASVMDKLGVTQIDPVDLQ